VLTSLSIRDVVLIEALDLQFGDGLSVLTGETGAGKSILLDALGLALGLRADSGLVRQGAVQASVTASFDTDETVRSLLRVSDLVVEPGEPLIVRRTVRGDGGSRAFINDQPVSVSMLRTLAAALVEIHGQHDDRGLVNPAGHRALLDQFAGADAKAVETAHAAWQAAEEALAIARAALADADRDREWLEHSVDELRSLAPATGEEEELAERRSRMQRGEKIAADLDLVRERLDGADGGFSQLRQAARILERIATAHPALADSLAAIDRALVETALAEEKLSSAAFALAFDPAALEADETRLFALRAVARKHRVAPDELPALAESLSAKLAAIDAGGEGLERLEAAAGAARDAYLAAAKAISTLRLEAASRLDLAVAQELAPLKLDTARFRTDVSRLPDGQWGPTGFDRIEFLISTNPGAPFAPLIKIASGGELSRFILALKVALAEAGKASAIVFDEIDRGVGGAVASAIGERLSRLADTSQLLVVTHSPQVAARGDHHFLISKAHDGFVTRTSVRLLDQEGRREEIARMLSGANVTNEARAQAERLLEAA
jgi:DNA repair protein RecN (Recombination protein N)